MTTNNTHVNSSLPVLPPPPPHLAEDDDSQEQVEQAQAGEQEAHHGAGAEGWEPRPRKRGRQGEGERQWHSTLVAAGLAGVRFKQSNVETVQGRNEWI